MSVRFLMSAAQVVSLSDWVLGVTVEDDGRLMGAGRMELRGMGERYHIILYSTLLWTTVDGGLTVLNCTLLYSTLLCMIVDGGLYCTELYSTLLYSTLLCTTVDGGLTVLNCTVVFATLLCMIVDGGLY